MANELTITEKMRAAINQFAGVEVIEEGEVGKNFFRGKENDGEVGIEISSNYKDCGENHRKFLNANKGTYSKYCFESPYIVRKKTASGLISVWQEPCEDLKSKTCLGIFQNLRSIDPRKAAIIIGALYGFEEAGVVNPKPEENSAAATLRKKMGLE